MAPPLNINLGDNNLYELFDYIIQTAEWYVLEISYLTGKV